MNQTINPAPTTELPIAGDDGVLLDLTDVAAAEVRRLVETQNLQGQYLRVGVQGGGCSGLTYSLHFDNEAGKFDRVYSIKGVNVVVDLKSSLYLKGTQIDYAQALTGGGFKFINPNASRSCGCGSSFSA